MNHRLSVLLIVTCMTAACHKTPSEPAKPADTGTKAAPAAQTPPAAPKPVPALLPDVIARVDGTAISRAEFERAIRAAEAQARGPVPPDRRDAIFRQVLDQIVAMRLLSAEAAARKLTVADAEVDAQVAQIRGQAPSEQAFMAALADRQLTLELLRADIRQQMLAMKLVNLDVKPQVSVGDKELTEYYQKNPGEFHAPEAAHVQHILIRLPEKADDATRRKARADAENVLVQARKPGADFSALAKQYSQDAGSAVNGGDLGFVPRGQTVPAFETAAFALQPGHLSGIVETPFGFHVIKAIARRDARAVSLEEVKPQLLQFLQNQQLEQKTGAYIEKLKTKAKVEILI